MTAKNFILNRLEELSERFPEVRFTYEFRSGSNTHVIEVLPLGFFQENDQYLESEYLFEKEFEEAFPNEEILFISSDSLVQIEKAERTFGLLLFSFEPESYSEINALSPVEDTFHTDTITFATAA